MRLTHLPAPLLLLILSTNPTPTLAADSEPHTLIETLLKTTCTHPTHPGDLISVHYTGSLLSTGAIFDSSLIRNTPITFRLSSGQVIAGWDEGLQNMCPGEKRRLTIPPELAYGERGAPPVIPPGATLVFETELVRIVGVRQGWVSTVSAARHTVTETVSASGFASASASASMSRMSSSSRIGGGDFSIATAPAQPPKTPIVEEAQHEEQESPSSNTNTSTPTSSPPSPEAPAGQCHLLGPFALIVQAALGGVALLALVLKRWRETPKRPWKIFAFDVSKQIVGSGLTHVLNLAISMLGSVELDLVRPAQNAVVNGLAGDETEVQQQQGGGGRATPNPCSFYILNLGIDTTLGIPILYLLLKLLHHLALLTPLARPPQSIKSGHYGNPPRATWWLKQCLLYFIALTGMKLFVLLCFALLPWLPWVGDWALRWTEGNEALQVAFAMFVFPLAVNAVQYWVIDGFIKEGSGDGGRGAYEAVGAGAEEGEDEEVGGEVEREEVLVGKGGEVRAEPVVVGVDDVEAGHSRGPSPADSEVGVLTGDVEVASPAPEGGEGNTLRGRR